MHELIFCFLKQKTAYEMRISDWSSDVCSSDLLRPRLRRRRCRDGDRRHSRGARPMAAMIGHDAAEQAFVEAWAGGRLHHAWLLDWDGDGRPPGEARTCLGAGTSVPVLVDLGRCSISKHKPTSSTPTQHK